MQAAATHPAQVKRETGPRHLQVRVRRNRMGRKRAAGRGGAQAETAP